MVSQEKIVLKLDQYKKYIWPILELSENILSIYSQI